MPKIVDNLMPHMIGDVVSLVTQPKIDYPRGRKKEQKLFQQVLGFMTTGES